MYLFIGGHDTAKEWMYEHVKECWNIENPTEAQMKGRFKSQASNAERNPDRYQGRTSITGNNEPASKRAIRRKQ